MNVKQLDRHSKSERLNYILSQMRGPDEITPSRLAEELDVSQRTIYRDLLTLEKGPDAEKTVQPQRRALPAGNGTVPAAAELDSRGSVRRIFRFRQSLRRGRLRVRAGIAARPAKNQRFPHAKRRRRRHCPGQPAFRRAVLAAGRNAAPPEHGNYSAGAARQLQNFAAMLDRPAKIA